jgi:hypothetical protein
LKWSEILELTRSAGVLSAMRENILLRYLSRFADAVD